MRVICVSVFRMETDFADLCCYFNVQKGGTWYVRIGMDEIKRSGE